MFTFSKSYYYGTFLTLLRDEYPYKFRDLGDDVYDYTDIQSLKAYDIYKEKLAAYASHGTVKALELADKDAMRYFFYLHGLPFNTIVDNVFLNSFKAFYFLFDEDIAIPKDLPPYLQLHEEIVKKAESSINQYSFTSLSKVKEQYYTTVLDFMYHSFDIFPYFYPVKPTKDNPTPIDPVKKAKHYVDYEDYENC